MDETGKTRHVRRMRVRKVLIYLFWFLVLLWLLQLVYERCPGPEQLWSFLDRIAQRN